MSRTQLTVTMGPCRAARRALMATALAVSLAMTVGSATAAATGITFDASPGTGAPPSTLGPDTMTPFGPDAQALGTVTTVATPGGSAIGFGSPMDHVTIGAGWNTWSNGYTGDVYTTNGLDTASINLPSGTSAFYFYAEPDPYATFDVVATSADGTTSGPIAVNGFSGAQYFGFYTDGSAPLTNITISSSVDFAVGEFGISAGPSVKPGARYVALGDSYSSGEGNPPFANGTDGGGDYCHRSAAAYPEVLSAAYATNPLGFYACSGAVTANITQTVHYTEPPQITDSGVDASANLVTMTIGGNDAGFSSVLQACIVQKLKADAQNALVGPIGQWLGLGADPSCAHSGGFTSGVNHQIDNVFWPVKQTYQQLVASTDPVNTSVMVADYPHIFPGSSAEQTCIQLSPFLTTDDQNFLNTAGDRLDGTLQTAAGQAGVNFVDVRSVFSGHAVCGNSGAWINGLSLASGNAGSCIWSVAGHCIIPGLPLVGSFHPNTQGHANGYAAAFEHDIDNAASRTPQGFPANPVPLPDPPYTPTYGPDTITSLTVTPVTTQAASCEGTFQAGQEVTLTGSGFQPNTSVTVYVTAPGQSAVEQAVATINADGTGAIDATVRVPLTAIGFVQPGASAGLISLDAIGLGPDGTTHADALSTAGLGPHGGECGTVETLPFAGFASPVSNPPALNSAQAGRTIPVKFTLTGANAPLTAVLAAGYPQSAPVSCTAPDMTLTSGTPTDQISSGSPPPSDSFNYTWKTDPSWSGCRELIVALVDGTYHRAVFQFR